jgi:ribonuclease Z
MHRNEKGSNKIHSNRRYQIMIAATLTKRASTRIIFLAIFGVFYLALSFPALAVSADDFSVTLLGTGTPAPSPERFGMSTLVEVGGQRLLFDMGRGVTIRLWQKLVSFGSINAHFLTHLHSDHVNGLPDLWLTGWLQGPPAAARIPSRSMAPQEPRG